MKYICTDFYEEFSCIGGKCIDSCCQKGWGISIDRNTYDRYQALDEPLRSRICSRIKADENGVYRIVLDGDDRCPFLNGQNLCDIYSLISESAMCYVCQVYPRETMQYYDVTMATLMLSCPEVARIVIEKKDPIIFRFMEDEDEVSVGNADWTLYNELINSLVIATDILQDRDLQLWQRLQLVLVEANIVQEHIEKQDLQMIRESIECLREKEYRQKIYAGDRTNPFAGALKWNWIYSLFESLVSCKGLHAGERNVLEKFRTIDPEDEQTYQMWNSEFKSLDLDIEYENIAVQCIFEYYMDALKGRSLYVNVTKMLVFLLLVRTLEVIGYHTKKELTVTDKTLIIAKISEVVEHSKILEVLAENIVNRNDQMEILRMIGMFN
ncbi:MAG: flagellin lysine-N-methylase [Eubacterium sp.]|nr:flagellin lysine-N-methylase [Eubacterium sp.]MCM1216362.1 flagellin lysine-N-methylase [Lachnospiraceae bacterium]MCM1303410.1 flagellin lysine-N-methylase [Butyrivibrio sp.]MCM1342537.1 flagellin lysine-N-methylase [Muribaculaceae bacterium]MCM1238212.1 flagellin lysine-N-methylase [Lachnospiraceae bacterium]